MPVSDRGRGRGGKRGRGFCAAAETIMLPKAQTFRPFYFYFIFAVPVGCGRRLARCCVFFAVVGVILRGAACAPLPGGAAAVFTYVWDGAAGLGLVTLPTPGRGKVSDKPSRSVVTANPSSRLARVVSASACVSFFCFFIFIFYFIFWWYYMVRDGDCGRRPKRRGRLFICFCCVRTGGGGIIV